MAKRNIIGIGGSAGSTEPLKDILRHISPDSEACVFVTTHVAGHGPRLLIDVLRRACPLPVDVAEDGAPVRPGRVVVAAADRHLLVTDDGVVLGAGPRENMARPAIDPMLRSLALTFGPRVVGVILSGALSDGAAGLDAVERCGGLAVVQDPADAQVAEMPRAAVAATHPEHIAPAATIGPLLAALAMTEAPAASLCPEDLQIEVEIAAGERTGSGPLARFADPVALTCPTCSGVLSQVRTTRPLRFRCQIGHALTADLLYAQQDEAVEQALRVALRVMEERSELVRRMAADARRQGRSAVAELYEEREREYASHAETLRKAVLIGLRGVVATAEGNADPALQTS